MNRILRYSIIGVVAIMMVSVMGCRKGPNDPFLSLKSRKSRLSGEWEVTRYYSQTETNGVVAGSNLFTNLQWSVFDSLGQRTGNGIYSFSIEKTGAYSTDMTQNLDSVSGHPAVYGTFSSTGYWYFAEANEALDVKDGELIVFQETDYSGTIIYGTNPPTSQNVVSSGPLVGKVYRIDELRSNKVVLIHEFEDYPNNYSHYEEIILEK